MVNYLQHYISGFIFLIYPKVCIVCGNHLVQSEKSICQQCVIDLPKTGFHLLQNNPVEKLFWGKIHVEFASAFFFFQKGSVAQKLLHNLKYKGNKEIGIELGKHYATELVRSSLIDTIDYIVPVPLHKNKLKKRGYNQSEMIAIGLSQVLSIPVETDTLVRAIENPTQTKKGVFERWENTYGVFTITNTQQFANKHILLVDDVLTTGSTIEACVQAIKQAPNAKVSFISLALASN